MTSRALSNNTLGMNRNNLPFAAVGFLMMLSIPANTQPVEQYPAPILSGERISSLPGQAQPAVEADDTPFGVDLSGLLIVSDRKALLPSASVNSIVVKSDNAVLNNAELQLVLEPFIGKPLSRKLIAEMRDAITGYMREEARPLVAVIAPPQEITAGTVQFLVVPYRLGDRRVERVATNHQITSEEQVLNNITLQPGDEVDSDRLLTDVNWLIRNPFRSVGVVFEPGEVVDTTDLILRLTDKKPWRVFTGTANSGTEATYRSRIFSGFVAANPLAIDQRFAYQLTVAPKTLHSNGEWFSFDSGKAYMAHSASYYLPLDWRHIITADAGYVRSRSQNGFFGEDSRTWQARADYAIPLTQFRGTTDVFAGFEFKRQKSETLFFGFSVGESTIDIAQFVVGARGEITRPKSRTRFDIDFYASPGGLTDSNTDEVFAGVSGDSEASAQYFYLNAVLEHYRQLPRDFGLNINAGGQLSDVALPETEKFGIGGSTSVRGYETNEISGDNGFFVQSELRLPVQEDPNLPLRFSPFAFFDVGSVGSWRDSTDMTIASTGLGIDVDFTDNFHLSFNAAYALNDAVDTSAGNGWIHFRMTASH